MDTIPNGNNPEWHHPECTQYRMDTIPNEHHPKWTQFRMSTYIYINLVTLVFIGIAWLDLFYKDEDLN